MSTASVQTVFVPGRKGWEGRQNSTTAVTVWAAVLGVLVAAGALVWLFDPSPAVKLIGVAALLAIGLAGWMLALQLRVERVRVVRAEVRGDTVRFAGATETRMPQRLLGVAGLLMLAAWLWAVLTAGRTDMPILTLLLVPVLAVLLVYGGARAWFGGRGAHELLLDPEGLTLRIPQNNLAAPWSEVAGAALEDNHVRVRLVSGQAAAFAARDFASDPVILAELVTHYAAHPRDRAQIGAGTLEMLRAGSF